MSLAELIPLVIKVSIVLTVFALGLEVAFEDVLSLAKRPVQLLKSLTAMDVIMPLVAVGLALAFDLKPVVKIALVALSISPVPPILPKRLLKAGGSPAFAYGLLVAAALIAIVFIPLALALIGRIFNVPIDMAFGELVKVVAMTVLLPIGAGVLVRRLAPALAQRLARPISLVAMAGLVLAVVPVLFKMWPDMMALVGDGTLLAFAVFTAVGLAAGQLLGGPDHNDRTVLALSTATRHPGVALTIAGATLTGGKAVLPAILLYMLVGLVLSVPYTIWRQRAKR